VAANTLNILKPSVNNLTARIFLRAAGLECEEVDVWGKKSTTEFLSKDPADLTPLLEEAGLPRGSEPAADVRGYVASMKAPVG
jgi:glutathione S-transferase